VDNFGNRVDYVSPYQNKQNRGRRPGTPAQPGSAQPRAASAGRGAGAGAAPGKGKRQGQATRGGQSQGRNGQPRRKNESRRIDEPVVTRQESAKPREKQPVIIHKESKIDRLPSLDQLEQLPSRPRGEKPALLTRNR